MSTWISNKVRTVLTYQEMGLTIEQIRENMGYGSIKTLKQYMKTRNYILINGKFVKKDLESINNLKKRLNEISKDTIVNRNIRVYKAQYEIFAEFCKMKNKQQAEALREAIEQYIANHK